MSSDHQMYAFDENTNVPVHSRPKPRSSRGRPQKEAAPRSVSQTKQQKPRDERAARRLEEHDEDDDEIITIHRPRETFKETGTEKVAVRKRHKMRLAEHKPPRKAPYTRQHRDQGHIHGEESEPIEEEEEEEAVPAEPVSGNGELKEAESSMHVQNDALSIELTWWKQKAKDLEAEKDLMAQRLEDLFSTQHAEAQQALEALTARSGALAKSQDLLIKDLSSQLAKVRPIVRIGQTAASHFLSREAADKEKKALEAEIKKIKGMIVEKDRIIAAKDAQIIASEATVKELRLELAAEIEKSKEILSKLPRNMNPVSRIHKGGFTGADDPKHTELIKLYEDVTNLLVTNIKFQPSGSKAPDETVFACVYTYMPKNPMSADGDPSAEEQRMIRKSINFTLRASWPNDDATSVGDHKYQTIEYTPFDLDKEPQEFVEALGFYGSRFAFWRPQFPLFTKKMRAAIAEFFDVDEDESMSDDEN